MKKKIELDDVEVIFDSAPLTDEEKKLISEYIQKDKTKRRKKSTTHNKSLYASR
jgi:hypothetical protein